MQTLLSTLIAPSRDRASCSTLMQWLPVWREVQASVADCDPFIASIASSIRADRLAWAFFSGYQGAILAAFRDRVKLGAVAALCVNEAGRKITDITTAVEFRGDSLYLHGYKSWALAGIDDLNLLVLARRSDVSQKGPGSLVVASLPLHSVGVSRGPSRLQAVVPELVHSEVLFESVSLTLAQLVPGDGYSEYAKPFRVFEDIFVAANTLAYLLAESSTGSWPTTWCQRCIAAISMLHVCSRLDLRDVSAHILVAGSLAFAGDVIQGSKSLWKMEQAAAHDRWLRDKQILSLGRESRRLRAVGAWDAKKK